MRDLEYKAPKPRPPPKPKPQPKPKQEPKAQKEKKKEEKVNFADDSKGGNTVAPAVVIIEVRLLPFTFVELRNESK
jgi:hypothetical protein